jgi:hypothetical protein
MSSFPTKGFVLWCLVIYHFGNVHSFHVLQRPLPYHVGKCLRDTGILMVFLTGVFLPYNVDTLAATETHLPSSNKKDNEIVWNLRNG